MKMTSRLVVRLGVAVVVAVCVGASAACRTVQGLGEDVSNAGKAGERAIDNATK